MTTVNDIVLIHFEGAPMSFARVEDISADIKRDWYHVRLLLLQVPLQTVTWILRDVYINGEPFTMDGKQMRLERIEAPPEPVDAGDSAPEEAPKPSAPGDAKVISFRDLKKK
ncbi:MAG: hypothetical protein JEZ11_25790 [Desulfobacterales bacterium]|nr:hypothetical protein [Desulfobacterales bacterium]